MIFKTGEHEEELVLGDVETVESSIDIQENLAFVLDTVSSKFYSYPIGSIVREITSNCFDAHVEAGVDEPVMIKMYYDLENDGYAIEFVDRGVGMNDERFNKIYMNWFSSTKRNTNEQIGGWGLGSKSPFAYTNQFMITSIADGIKTTRILSKVQGGLPKAETVYRNPSTEHNGTTIKISIPNYPDAQKFALAIKNQLTYFDNVFVDGSNSFQFDNNYRIYDCNNFKYRSGSSNETYNEFDSRAASQQMHILLGNVKYPINWDVINMHQYVIPVGVKFKIGEISVTPNREVIEYREESIALIKERIKRTVKELKKIYAKQNPIYDDFARYLAAREEVPRITFKPSPDSSINDYLYMNGLQVDKRVLFRPLKEIERLPRNFFFEYKIESIENGLHKEKRRTFVDNDDVTRSRIATCYYAKSMTKYGNLYIGRGRVILRQRWTFKDLREELGFKIYRSKSSFNSWYKNVSAKQNGNPPKLGSAYAVWRFRKFTEQTIRDLTIDYPTVSEEWIKDYKKKQVEESNQTRRKLNQLILTYPLGKGSGTETPVHKLAKSEWVIYIMKNQEEKYSLFEKCRDMIDNQNKIIKYRPNPKDPDSLYYETKVFQFIVINETNFKQIKHLNNLIHIDNFFRIADLQPILNRIYLASRWYYDGWYDKFKLYRTGIEKVSPYYHNLASKVSRFITNYQSHLVQTAEQLDKLRDKIKPYGSHKCTLNARLWKKELDSFLEKADVLIHIPGLPDEYAKILINHSLKVTKLNYVKYGNEDQIQTDRPKPNRDIAWLRARYKANREQGRAGQSSPVSEGCDSETDQSQPVESGESLHSQIEGNHEENRDSENQGESSLQESEEGREESGSEFNF